MSGVYRERIAAVLRRIIRTADLQAGSRGFEFIEERTQATAHESAWRVPGGYSAAHVRRQLPVLAASCGAEVELLDRGGVVILRVIVEELPRSVPLVSGDLRPDRLLMGYDRQRQPIYHPLNTHLLAAGASRSGKTDWLRFAIYQLWLQGYEIRICDLKGFSFFPFEGLPGVTVASSLPEAYSLLGDCLQELEERKRIVRAHRNRDVLQSFRPVVTIIDEAAALSPSQNSGEAKRLAKECDEIISLLGQQGREPRMFAIYCTQRPDMDVINKQFKANVEASLAFRCKDETNSRIILGRGGAELIPPDAPGRCIYSYDRDHLLQVPYVGGDDAWSELLRHHGSEVMSGGQSQRRPADRRIEDAEYRAAADDRAARGGNVQGGRQPREAGVRISIQPGEGSAAREPAPGRYAQSLEAHPLRPGRGWDGSPRRALPYVEDCSLVDDW